MCEEEKKQQKKTLFKQDRSFLIKIYHLQSKFVEAEVEQVLDAV